jgi:hypothetical protein
MRFPSHLLFVLLISIVVLPQLAVAESRINNYNESFYSREFFDPLNTTAWWDTLAGQLKLPLFQISLTGSASITGTSRGLAIAGDYAYIAVTPALFKVVDISAPATPAVVGTYALSDLPFDVDVSGDYAYVTAETADLYVINITDPAHPTLAKYLDTPEHGAGLDVAGDYAYVTDPYYGLYVYNVTNPTNPVRVGSYDTPGVPIDVEVAGHYAYVTDGTAGLQVIDISSPTGPTLAGSVDTPGSSFRLAIAGQLAYVADSDNGLQVIDISDPANPAIIGAYDTPGRAYDAAPCGNIVYVADRYSGVHAIDVSDPSNPSLAGGYNTSGEAYQLVVAGNQLYVADGSQGLKVLRIADDTSMPIPAGAFPSGGLATAVAGYGNHMYVAGADLDIFDVSDPLAPARLGGGSLPGFIEAAALYGNYAYFATGGGMSVYIYDISDPSSPVAKASYPANNNTNDVVVSGNYLFVAQAGIYGLNGLAILDISDPPNPSLSGSLTLKHEPQALQIAGDYAYMAVYRSGLVVVDISNIASPDTVVSLQTGSDPITFESGALDIVVEGDYAYVSDRWTGIVVVDISDPEIPFIATSIGTPDRDEDMVVAGDHLIVASGNAGLVVYDITDPTAPVWLGTRDTSGYGYSLALFGEYACIADGSSGAQMMQVYDRDVLPAHNVARSLTIPWGEPITDFAIMAVKTGSGSIEWEISADGGAHWQPGVSGADPELVDFPGTELQWRATLQKNQAGDYPICHNLFIVPNQLVPVTVSGFEAAARDGGVELQWNVHADETIRGFNIYRRTGAGGSDIRLTAGGLIAAGERRYVDTTVEPGTGYTYTLGVVKADGSEVLSRSARVTPKVRELALRQNFPNPFNPVTTISFSLPKAAPARLVIYDAAGARVRVLVDGIVTGGTREYLWDGKNTAGTPVGSGVYFYRLEAGGKTITRKMVLLK